MSGIRATDKTNPSGAGAAPATGSAPAPHARTTGPSGAAGAPLATKSVSAPAGDVKGIKDALRAAGDDPVAIFAVFDKIPGFSTQTEFRAISLLEDNCMPENNMTSIEKRQIKCKIWEALFIDHNTVALARIFERFDCFPSQISLARSQFMTQTVIQAYHAGTLEDVNF